MTPSWASAFIGGEAQKREGKTNLEHLGERRLPDEEACDDHARGEMGTVVAGFGKEEESEFSDLKGRRKKGGKRTKAVLRRVRCSCSGLLLIHDEKE